jgi:hypothetical protein
MRNVLAVTAYEKEYNRTHAKERTEWRKKYISDHPDYHKKNYAKQQKICFHYSNLQPLWAEDNLKKGCKYDV